MAVSTVSAPPVTDYPVIFRAYIVKSTQHILAKVRQAGAILPPADRNQALHTLSYAFKLPEAWSDTRQLLLAMAPKMEQAGYRDDWIPFLEQGIYQSQYFDDAEVEAELQLQLGTLYRLQSKYEQARIQLEASISGFKMLDVLLDQARALNELAHVARLQRQFEETAHLVEAALGLLEDRATERAYSYLVLGLVALDKRAWPEAIDCCKQALSLWEQENNSRMIARTLTILGAAYHRLEKYPEAIAVYEQAIALFAEVQDLIYQAVARMNLGNVYFELEQWPKALVLYRPAERIFHQVQDQHHLAMVEHNMGMAYHQLQQYAKAEAAFLSSIKKKQEMGNVASLVNTMAELGLLYLAQGQAEETKSIFEAALEQLAQIEGEPGYDYLFETVSTHLRKVSG